MKNQKKIQFLNPVASPHKLPISQVGVAGDFLYTWGYGEEVRKGHERADMRKVFEHIKACLAAKGLGFADVVKVTALLTDLKQWEHYSVVYKEYFKPPYPCRTTIPVPTKEKILEIDVVAYKKGLSTRRAPRKRG
jgi:enamine deaminase RidA (YjgF/YER057c/UK114 family)